MASDAHLENCIALCRECRTECIETLFTHCLQQGGEHAAPAHVGVMTDCIQACQAAADFMTRHSPRHAAMCLACAEICEACARSCEAIGDTVMQRCAEICRRCAEHCRAMGEQRQAA